MFVMPQMGINVPLPSSLSFPAPGRLVMVVKERWSRIGGGEEARRLQTQIPGSVRCGVPGPILFTSSNSPAYLSAELTLFPELA